MQCLKKSKPRKSGSVEYSIFLSPATDSIARENHHNANFFHDSTKLSPHYLTNNYIRNPTSSQTVKIIRDKHSTIPDLNEIRSSSLELNTANPEKKSKKYRKNVKNSYHRSKYCQIF
ncbi:hypothetical protein SteCoe_30751 [Stentor coeruleus]|uniref:Uncharacterized protein n=1 Tax=Stentor coeruleus TaxID=5963 RepID=A0A1R2B2Z2_9CILI|nr:hypothetical protein SteCoe_30751 [Stentor coeruleus]